MHSLSLFFLQGKVYVYDSVLKPNVSQEQVYAVAAKSIVKGEKKKADYAMSTYY